MPKSISGDNGKIIVTEKDMSKLFSYDFLAIYDSMIKCHQNLEKRLILGPKEKKILDLDYYEEHLTSISNKTLLWHC